MRAARAVCTTAALSARPRSGCSTPSGGAETAAASCAPAFGPGAHHARLGWRPGRGSHVSETGKLTSAAIDARDCQRAIVAPGGNEFAIRERSVRDEMRGCEAWVRRIDDEFAKAAAEREDGGDRFVSQMHPCAGWKRGAERSVRALDSVLDDRESYGPRLDRVPGMEKRMRETATAITETVRRDAPVRKEVEAAHKARTEREMEILQHERELERILNSSRSMSAEIDIGRQATTRHPRST